MSVRRSPLTMHRGRCAAAVMAAQSLSPFGFFQVQRSYIVNLKYIERVNSREIMLCNGVEIAIGRTHGREFKKAFFRWRMLFDD